MNEYTSKGGVARAHSDNGNLRDDGERLFSYDYKNRLVAAFRKSDSAPIAQYLYLSDNRRTKKTVFSQTTPGVVEKETLFLYDGWQVCEEQSGAGVTETTYVYNPVYIDEVCQVVRTGAHPLGAGALWTHQNARADVVAVSDASGVVVEKRFFDDFGGSFDEAKQPVAGSAVGNPYGFQGRRLDSETGLVFFRNRYYSPETGRFLQRDPVWDAGNFGGQYSFAGNGPVSGRDAGGLQGGQAELDRKELDAIPVPRISPRATTHAELEGRKKSILTTPAETRQLTQFLVRYGLTKAGQTFSELTNERKMNPESPMAKRLVKTHELLAEGRVEGRFISNSKIRASWKNGLIVLNYEASDVQRALLKAAKGQEVDWNALGESLYLRLFHESCHAHNEDTDRLQKREEWAEEEADARYRTLQLFLSLDRGKNDGSRSERAKTAGLGSDYVVYKEAKKAAGKGSTDAERKALFTQKIRPRLEDAGYGPDK